MTITAFHIQGALAIAVCAHILLWAKTREGVWYWLSVMFATLRRAEITTYRWAIPAWRAWVDEFKHFQEPNR
jgi:hypothetical protein